jgi:hypothetical protein
MVAIRSSLPSWPQCSHEVLGKRILERKNLARCHTAFPLPFATALGTALALPPSSSGFILVRGLMAPVSRDACLLQSWLLCVDSARLERSVGTAGGEKRRGTNVSLRSYCDLPAEGRKSHIYSRSHKADSTADMSYLTPSSRTITVPLRPTQDG